MMNTIPEQPITLRISSSPGHLPIVRTTVQKICEYLGFDAEAAGAVVLSVDEALTNIIKHAYQGDNTRPIQIDIGPVPSRGTSGMQIQIRDYGRWVDPAEIKSRDLHDIRPGGLGVHIINECMDSVEFTPAEGGGTLLTMVKLTKSFPSKQEARK